MFKGVIPWRFIVVPHENIRQGLVKQDDFAASLADVQKGRGNLDYVDPDRFFDRTFLTAGLRRLASEVLARLTGRGDGDAVMQIQTPFGGGKTHTLITLYHLVKNGADCFNHPSVKEFMQGHGWTTPPSVPVAAFDGNQVGVGNHEIGPGIAAQTMWGHIAYQLGGPQGYEIVRRFDADRISPDGNDIDRLFTLSKGGLIILDEVANYVETAAAVPVYDSTLAAQSRTFLQRLGSRAGQHDRAVVVATLPRSDGTQTHGTASLQVLQALQELFGRVQKVREPVEGDEVHEIIRRRLFMPFVDDAKVAVTGETRAHDRDTTIETYINEIRSRGTIPDMSKEPDYALRFPKCYPFHPALLDILNVMGANPKFQRTRGVLRVLALVVADLSKKEHDGGLIHASDIDMTNEELRAELLELVDREFRSAVEADITGSTSNSAVIDKQTKTMTMWRVASGLATTAFLYTCESGNTSRGATESEMHLATARPEAEFCTFQSAIYQIAERFHFINVDGGRFRFCTTPNLNRLLLDAKNAVSNEQVLEVASKELGTAMKGLELTPVIWPESSGDITDTPVNKLVIMPLDQTYGESSPPETEKLMIDYLAKSGNSIRTNRNAMVFLAPDHKESPRLRDAVRDLIAYRTVFKDANARNLSKSQIAQVTNGTSNATNILKIQMFKTYRHLVHGGGVEANLNNLDMGTLPPDKDQVLGKSITDFLKDKQKFTDRLAPLIVMNWERFKVWPEDEPKISLQALQSYFRQYTHLPILKDDDVIKHTVVDGVLDGTWALCTGTSVEEAVILHYKTKISIESLVFDEQHFLIRGDLA
ncbi:MAG: DUF499 domain-containing protein, partial [Polyangiaceae bacterium]|nr:DUF499 domain-containing protein [Polyangiaceae bacterium]